MIVLLTASKPCNLLAVSLIQDTKQDLQAWELFFNLFIFGAGDGAEFCTP